MAKRAGRHARPTFLSRHGKAAAAVALPTAVAAGTAALVLPASATTAPAQPLAPAQAPPVPASAPAHATLAAAQQSPAVALPAHRRRHPRHFTVVAGSTLSGIARALCGHASRWPALWHANKGKVANPDLIYPGQRLTVSCAKVTRAAVTAATRRSSPPGSGPVARSVHGTVTCAALGGSGLLPAHYARMFGYLTSRGFSRVAAAGIEGNIEQESGGLPASQGSGGGGLIGWTPESAAFPHPLPAPLRAQLADVVAWSHRYASTRVLNHEPTAGAAARYWERAAERAGIPAMARRTAAARAVWHACVPRLAHRRHHHHHATSHHGYADPTARAHVVPERIDDGVDYAAWGPLDAVSGGTVAATWNGGWPGGAFISEHLNDGRWTYFAEDITPTVSPGQYVRAGQELGYAHGQTELGWAAPGGGGDALSAVDGDAGSYPTREGLSFSRFIHRLGAPAGIP